MRTTRKELQSLVNIINNTMPEGVTMYLEWAYGKPRLFVHKPEYGSGCAEVSPRLPMGEMALWLNAFIDGLDWGSRKGA